MRATHAIGSHAAAVVMLCWTVIGSAQSQQQGTTGKPGDPSDNPEITVIGCLLRTDRSAWRPGTSNHTAPGESPKGKSGLVLKDAAVWTGPAPTGPVVIRSEREFSLIHDKNVKLEKSVGRQVEIKGKLLADATGTTGRQTGQPSGRGSGENAATPPPRVNVLQVTALRPISDDCPPPR